ncbi:MAG: alpha/beta hydrolase [Nevskiales bacterium]
MDFDHSAFPYVGPVPSTGEPFLNVEQDGRHAHQSPRGLFWADEAYADRNVLLSVPRGFSPNRPVAIVLYFHGNGTVLDRDVIASQAIPEQLGLSGMNAVLIAPQMARDAADSSAGHFWDKDFLSAFLREASARLADCLHNPHLAAHLDAVPVIVVAYSGGYNPAAAILRDGGAGGRIAGVALFDALYAEEDAFAGWAKDNPQAVLFSAFGKPTRDTSLKLMADLQDQQAHQVQELPPRLIPGDRIFIDLGDVKHLDLMNGAWIQHPLTQLLRRWPLQR